MDVTRRYCVSLVLVDKPTNEIEKSIMKTINEIEQKHKYVYDELEFACNIQNLQQILNYLFKDDVYNWGRVVNAIIWTRKLNKTNAIEAGNILADKIEHWVTENGGFEHGFIEFFNPPVADKSAFIALGLIGISAACVWWSMN